MWRDGKFVTLGWLSVSHGFTAEVMARQGFDALCVDMQHGLTDMNDVWPMLQAVPTAPAGIPAHGGGVDGSRGAYAVGECGWRGSRAFKLPTLLACSPTRRTHAGSRFAEPW